MLLDFKEAALRVFFFDRIYRVYRILGCFFNPVNHVNPVKTPTCEAASALFRNQQSAIRNRYIPAAFLLAASFTSTSDQAKDCFKRYFFHVADSRLELWFGCSGCLVYFCGKNLKQ